MAELTKDLSTSSAPGVTPVPIPTINTLMTRDPICVHPEGSLIEAASILSKHRLSGLPVVDDHGILVGIMTDNDLLTKGSAIHLPTFLKLMEGIEIYRNDSMAISDDVKKILAMKVKDVMNADPFMLTDGATIQEGLQAFAEHHRVNPIPVVDANKKVIGILSRSDIIKMFGAPSVVASVTSGAGLGAKATDINLASDQHVDEFLSDFEKQFTLVTKTETHYWLLYSILFAVIGFAIAFAFIVQFGPGK
jgi:CBS domain-containing protein